MEMNQNRKVVQADELVRQLDYFNELGVKYKITENLSNNRQLIYETIGLVGEMELFFGKESIRFDDDMKVIQQRDGTSIMKMLLLQTIQKITTYCYDDENKANIQIKIHNGLINIDVYF